MIGIICATTKEKEALLEKMNGVYEEIGKPVLYHNKLIDNKYYVGKFDDKDVVVCHSGIGKVYASIGTMMLMQKYEPTLIISLGEALSLSDKAQIGDTVLALRVADWDVDYPDWERSIISDKISFGCDGRVNYFAADLFKGDNTVDIGPIVSGDEYLYRPDQLDEIKKFFPEALCVEMEGSSIANTAYAFNTPVVIARTIVGNPFEEKTEVAADRIVSVCEEILKKY